MAHIPHLFVARPWDDDDIELHAETLHHVTRVLRHHSGEPLTYTDGAGTVGEGRFSGTSIERGEEKLVSAPPMLTMAVAPPASTDRTRFMVEKLAELGVSRIMWLDTRHGEGKPPRRDKAEAWSIGALEQSRGAHLMDFGDLVHVETLVRQGPVLFAERGAGSLAAAIADMHDDGAVTIAIGPEGGWHPAELEFATQRVGLCDRVLRVETAAIAAAALVIHAFLSTDDK